MGLIILSIVLVIIAFVLELIELFYPDKLWIFNIHIKIYFSVVLLALLVTFYVLFFNLIIR